MGFFPGTLSLYPQSKDIYIRLTDDYKLIVSVNVYVFVLSLWWTGVLSREYPTFPSLSAEVGYLPTLHWISG